MLSPRLETERLVLRRYEEADIDMQYEIITDDRLSKYIKFPDLTKEEELKALNNIVSGYFDFAGIQAIRHNRMYMECFII